MKINKLSTVTNQLIIKVLKLQLFDILKQYSPTPQLDADYILCEVFNLSKTDLYSKHKIISTNQQLLIYKNILKRIKRQEPLAYIFEKQEFYNLPFKVSPATLIPRPETELIVEYALKFINLNNHNIQNLSMIDFGTGSGCIPISILKNSKTSINSTVIDIHLDTLAIARTNAINLLSQSKFKNITFTVQDIFTYTSSKKFNIITSNPPYIPHNVIDSLDINVKKFEPTIALDGGIDGLNYYHRLYEIIQLNLATNGISLIELYSPKTQEIQSIFKNMNTQIIKDLAGLDRLLVVYNRK